MRMKIAFAFIAWICLCGVVLPTTLADTEGGRFHVDVGLSYMNGMEQLNSALENEVNTTYGPGTYSSIVVPVGLQVDPYYLFSFGLGIGGSLGPDEVFEFSDQYGDTDDVSAVIPLGLDVRYELLNDTGFVPYVRAGVRYPIAVGDIFTDGEPGAFAAIGVDITKIHLGLEVSYDSSTVEVNYGGLSQRETPSGFMATIYARF